MKHKLKGELRLPANEDLAMYFRHFIFDDDHRVLFCFVPKVSFLPDAAALCKTTQYSAGIII